MRNVTVAAVQMRCSKSVEKNIAHAEELVRQAAAKGAEIVLLPELFERPYFCQERRYEYYEYAQTAEENPAVRHFSRVAAELGIVIPVSFYEKEVNNTYNSVAVLDADGKNLGVYRKTHIPDDHYYQEKFYFTPGDTGFKVFDTRFGTIGVGICWDQWFPETARCMALQGAELLCETTLDKVLANMDKIDNDRAILRAIHFFKENERVERAAKAVEEKDGETVLKLLSESGKSSWELLQNCYPIKAYTEQKISVALALTDLFLEKLGKGICRIHGGGFAGVIMCVVPEEETENYVSYISEFAGKENVYPMNIRAVGAVHIEK